MIEDITNDIKQKGQLIVLMKFGSHLYGTDTPESDVDYKGVYLPNISDVILGKEPKSSITVSTGDPNGKNTKNDIDAEFFHLKGFMKLCEEGQVCALDMLFAPDEMIIEKSPIWDEIIKNRDKLLHKGTSAFVGYCRKQTAKYGIKGSRIDALEFAVEGLEEYDKTLKLGEVTNFLVTLTDKYPEFFKVEKQEEGKQRNIGGGGIKDPMATMYLESCGKKLMFNSKIKDCLPVLKNILSRYGDRAKMAQQNEGIDWKAVSHAVRCCYQAIELLKTHHIEMPLKKAKYIKAIKQGAENGLQYLDVAETLEVLMEALEGAKEISTLPEKADREWMDEFVVENTLAPILSYVAKMGLEKGRKDMYDTLVSPEERKKVKAYAEAKKLVDEWMK